MPESGEGTIPQYDPLLPELLDLIRKGSCVAFVGSGLSSGIYPTWEELISTICHNCGLGHIDSTQPLNADSLMELADTAKAQDRDSYDRTLIDTFSGTVTQTRRAYELLMKLPFKLYLTINFDPLLADETRKPENQCSEIYKYPSLPYKEKRDVYYLHGLVEKDSDLEVVLSKTEFEEAYHHKSSLYNILYRTFVWENLLFVGCGLREPALQFVLDMCHKQQRSLISKYGADQPPRRYILKPYKYEPTSRTMQRLTKQEHDESQRFEELGIKVVRYDPRDRHSGIEEMLEHLHRLPPLNVRSGFEEGDLQ